MNDQVLLIDQMQELVELGFGPDWIHDHSSMMWVRYPNPCTWAREDNPILTRLVPASGEYYGIGDIDYIPTLTFHDLTKALPKFLNVGDKTYFLTLMYDISGGVVVSYCTEHIKEILHSEGNSNQTLAVFRMLKWCKEKNYQ